MVEYFRRMFGHYPKVFSPSWATNQEVELLDQSRPDQTPLWESPGKNMETEIRRRKSDGLPSTWMLKVYFN